MKVEIPKFKEFPDSNISGRMIVNPYWLEHLLNLFCQGYFGEIWEEIEDTKFNMCNNIENIGYGILNEGFFNDEIYSEEREVVVDYNQKGEIVGIDLNWF